MEKRPPSNATSDANMSQIKVFLEDEFRTELIMQQRHLKNLSRTLSQQLQETGKRQKEKLVELEKKIILSTHAQQEPSFKKQLNHKTVVKRRSFSDHHRPREKLNSPSSACLTSKKLKRSTVGTSKQSATETQQCERVSLLKTTQTHQEENAVAECQRKFTALPVPSHVTRPLFQEMKELKDKERKECQEQRKTFLLSLQKPFSFQVRENGKMEKLVAKMNRLTQEETHKAASVKKSVQNKSTFIKMEKDSQDRDQEAQQEVCRPVQDQKSVQKGMPVVCSSPKHRAADRTKKEKLGFLDEQPSFHPRINQQVPDFDRLHKALQTEVLRNSQSKEGTKCQPFYLRTSALPQRQKIISPETSQEPKISHLNRSRSLGALTSLSTDTLPTYITDAARRRSMAIRKSQELRHSKEQESEDWFKKYQLRSQAMRRNVGLHAKSLDSNHGLKKGFKEKLRKHMMADQQRMREYSRELQEMKTRVSERPFLFEQLKQKNARALAEQTYRNTLKKAGVTERFVEEKGAAVEESPMSSGLEGDSDDNDLSNDNYIQSREENVDDGEKIEDVDEESVKSRGEEMP